MEEQERQEGRQPRRLLWFSAAFFAAAAEVCLLFLTGLRWWEAAGYPLAGTLFLRAILALFRREKEPAVRAALAGLLVGCLWCGGYLRLVWQPTQDYDGRSGQICLELTEPVQGRTSYGMAYGLVTRLDGEPCRLKVKVYLLDGSPQGQAGDRLEFQGTIQAAKRDWRAGTLQEGRFLTVYQQEPEIFTEKGAMTPLRALRRFAGQIVLRTETLLPGDEGALLAALLTGDRTGFSTEFLRALRVSGAQHITAVSGLHVSILAGILMWLLGKRAGLTAAVPAALFYAGLAGFSPSVMRAAVLLIFWAAAFWLKRDKDSLTSLAAALLLLVGACPFACMSAGLLLSFASTLGLILLAGPLRSAMQPLVQKLPVPWLKKPLGYLAGAVSATLAATVFTLPLNQLLFDTVPLWSLVSNLLILWAVTLVMALGILLLLLSLVWMPAAALLARWVVVWPLKWITGTVRWVGSWRFAAADSADLFLALGGTALLAALLLWRGKRLSGRGLLAVSVGAVLLTAGLTAGSRMLSGEVRIENCGGSPVFLIRGEGVSVVNCGSSPGLAAERVQTALTRWNAAGIETLLCTTDNYKTQGGLPAVLELGRPARLLVPSEDGTASPRLEGFSVAGYRRTGQTVASGLTLQLLRGGEGVFALRLTGDRFSLLSLCGLSEKQAAAALEEGPCQADILVVDDRLTGGMGTLYQLCQAVEPARIYVITNGYSAYEGSFGDTPLTLIEWEGVTLRFAR